MNAARFNDKFVRSNSHASAIRTAGTMDSLVADRFILGSTKTSDRLSIEHPWPPLLIDDRQDEIMMVDVCFNVLPVRETVFNQLAPNASSRAWSFAITLVGPHI